MGFGLALLAALPAIAHAEKTTLGLSPAIMSVAAKPGDVIHRELVISNVNTRGLPVGLRAESLYFQGVIPGVDIKPYDASSWVKFVDDHYVFNPKETKQIPIRIEIPENASPGGHYAEITVRGLSFEQLSRQVPTSIVVPEVSSTVLINVAGNIRESLQITSKDLFPSHATKNSIVTTEISVINSGNVHDLVTPTIVLVNTSGTEKAIPMQAKLVLPQTATTFTHDWVVPDRVGTTQAYVKITYGDNRAIIKTQPENMLVTPPIILTFLRILGLTTLLYIALHYRNLGTAWRALWRSNK